MAAVPVTIVGTITDNEGSRQATIAGIATITGLGVGGGPIEPDNGGEGPPSIWPSPGHPEHPIHIPPTIWPNPGHPAHPIEIPIPHPPEIQGPDLQVKIVWTEDTGWAVILVPAGPAPAPSGSRRR